MSIAIMTAVWRLDMPATDKMVLLALADAANDDGVTWIAVASRKPGEKLDLKKKCSLSERAIQGAIKRLCEGGFLSRNEKPGRGVIYTVTPAADAPRSRCAPADDDTNPRSRCGETVSNRQSSEAKASSESIKDDEFERFWLDYPRKVGKGAARKAYKAARKKTDHETIVGSLRVQRGWGVWDDPAFAPHAATWLNGERWLDEPGDRKGPSSRPAANGNGFQPVSMVEIARRRAEARGAADLSGDGWIPAGSDGVFVRGSNG